MSSRIPGINEETRVIGNTPRTLRGLNPYSVLALKQISDSEFEYLYKSMNSINMN